MMLPAAAARFLTVRGRADVPARHRHRRGPCVAGLLLSYHAALPSGPSIILSAGVVYAVSIFAGTRGIAHTRAAPRLSARTA